MSAECYRIKVPEGRRLTGLTATGERVPILPGEYHVHRLMPRTSLASGAATLRFVGVHGDNDVHIRLPPGEDIQAALAVDVEPLDESAARSPHPSHSRA